MAIKLHNSFMMHPGSWLRAEVVDHYRLSVTAAAKHLGVTRAALSNLLNGNSSLSPEMALRFERAFGIDARTILNMQANHDLTMVKPAAIKVKRWEAIPA